MIIELLTSVTFWLALGIFLLIIEIFIGAEFYSLTMGLGSLITAFIINTKSFYPLLLEKQILLNQWQMALVIWCIVSVLILVPLRKYVHKSDAGEDINKY